MDDDSVDFMSTEADEKLNSDWWEKTPLLNGHSSSTSNHPNTPFARTFKRPSIQTQITRTWPLREPGVQFATPRPTSLYLPSPWADQSSVGGPPQRRRGIKKLSRKSVHYDDATDGEALESTGMRIWYSDYSTIDWMHDLVKEHVRLRQLRSMKGLRGFLAGIWDASQAWILVLLIGIAAGCVASLIDVIQDLLTDLKSGYCSSNILSSQSRCCAGSQDAVCTSWIEWTSTANSPFEKSQSYLWSYLWYIGLGVLFATVSAGLVQFTAHIRSDSNVESSTSPNASTPHKIVYHAAGSGIPEVKTILSGFVIRGFLGFRTLVIKSFGLILAVASGLTIGKEGPIVHIACCIGNVLSRIFGKYARNEGKRREMLSAAAAAGVSVAFGAPIGGVLFSLEEVSYYFPSKTMWRSLFCALIASLTVKFLNPLGTGQVVMFQVSYTSSFAFFELLFFALLGVIGGLYGALFIKANMWYQKLRGKSFLRNHPIKEVMMLALVTSALNYLNVFSRDGMAGFVGKLFAQCKEGEDGLGDMCKFSEMGSVAYLLVQFMLLKAVLVVITFGSKIPAGIFIPSMAIGGSVGRLLGMLLLHLHTTYPNMSLFQECHDSNCIVPGVYAMVASAAALSGVTRMTISLTVILIEVTGQLTHAVPIMIAILTAKWVADGFGRDSIYDKIIDLNNLPYLETKQDYLVGNITIAQVMEGAETIKAGRKYTIEELVDKLSRLYQSAWSSDGGFPLVQSNILVGWIGYAELEHALGEAQSANCDIPCYFKRPIHQSPHRPATPHPSFTPQSIATEGDGHDFSIWVNWAPLTISVASSMDIATELFVKMGAKVILVVEDGGFVGLIHKKRLISYLKNKNSS
ncbi:hypothetical protein SmJEL517_g03121 [Synchytrium microbalum]|uniref:Chloride channel protein n=1 Tax=Synchytrium microbalum TaxID=1806994 RepID=A0A507C497_9FUNG|nr:uncharacterized protein SmJEL517_g03121 [Synchytrium microbalum]TPX34208.1 hypothetical protein SmJEL517_g03121 [Synchytrium microbalum]